jgi:2-desacetyl-2-hydroxyethyl bacteriochlorophyllide A dehydrogenase
MTNSLGTTTALVAEAPRQVRLRSTELRPVGPTGVLVRARATLVSNGTELTAVTGAFEPESHWARWVRYPFTLGYSFVGEVVAVGPEVETIKPGDRIVARTSHQSMAVLDQHQAWPVPEGVTDRQASWFAMAAIALNAVRKAPYLLGGSAGVVGLGPVGQLLVQYVVIAGCLDVVAIAPRRFQCELARANGASKIITSRVPTDTMELPPLDVVFDATGNAEALSGSLALVRRFGTLVLVGDTGFPSRQSIHPNTLRWGLTLIGAHDSDPPRDQQSRVRWDYWSNVDVVFRLLAEGRLDTDSLVTDVVSPDRADTVFERLEARNEGILGVIIDWASFSG